MDSDEYKNAAYDLYTSKFDIIQYNFLKTILKYSEINSLASLEIALKLRAALPLLLYHENLFPLFIK